MTLEGFWTSLEEQSLKLETPQIKKTWENPRNLNQARKDAVENAENEGRKEDELALQTLEDEMTLEDLKEILQKDLSRDEKFDVAHTLTVDQIDQFTTVAEKQLLQNFFIENGEASFYGNRQLEQVVGLGEIFPNTPDFQYLRVNGVICRRVTGLREYYQNPKGNYQIVLDDYQVEPVSLEEGSKIKFSEETQNNSLYESQLVLLAQQNESLAEKIRLDPNFKLAKKDFLKMLETAGKVEADPEDPVLVTKTALWKETIKEAKWNLSQALNQYLEILVSKNLITPKEVSVLEELTIAIENLKRTNPDFTLQLEKWFTDGAFSPLSLKKETLIALEKAFSGQDLEKMPELDSEAKELLATEKGKVFAEFLPSLLIANQKYDVPIGKMVRLMILEGSGGDPNRRNPYSSALGLGQMIKSTWKEYKEPGLNNENDRQNGHHQIQAMAKYLATIHGRNNCSWEETLAYYHTWEGIKNISNAQLRDYVQSNPAIASRMQWFSQNAYFAAAVNYYNRPLA